MVKKGPGKRKPRKGIPDGRRDGQERGNMELYIHYPFCEKKCNYCDFLSAPATIEDRAVYMRALNREIRGMGEVCRNKCVDTVFIGGGTPSLMEPEELMALMEAVRASFCLSKNCEITMEANPGTLDRDFLIAASASGIGRLSLGLQSADNKELEYLGRIHKYEDFCESFQQARESGIKNINVDLMSALPGQTAASWERTLELVSGLGPEHVSAYSLIIEEGTPFYALYHEADRLRALGECQPSQREMGTFMPKLPDEDTERQMYQLTESLLTQYGYRRYEISNYARPGFECRHNVGYWRRVDYLGTGLGASSLMDGKRFDNTRDLNEYLNFWGRRQLFWEAGGPAEAGCHKNIQILDQADAMAEFMFLGLRLTKGVRNQDFIHCFGQSFMDIYGKVITKHCQNGLLHYIEETGQLYFTARGLDVSNYVLCDFL